MPHLNIRTPTGEDAEVLSTLLADYLRESYPGHTGSSTEQLRRDVLGPQATHHVLLAEVRKAAIGFAAWDAVYDMHWAVAGAQIADIYVASSHRGLGVALALMARVAADVRASGGAFLRGGAYDRTSTRRAYARVAVVAPSGETHLSGRAFRQLAELADRPVREIIQALPPREWNFSN
jgi:ribosomal protein S18 acetylase RimI-like enzyme